MIDLTEFITFLSSVGNSHSDQRNNRRARNSPAFRFVLFFLSVLTSVGIFAELGINPRLLTDIGWWLALLPLALLPAYLFIRVLYQTDHLIQLSPALLIYIIILFLAMGIAVTGIWFV